MVHLIHEATSTNLFVLLFLYQNRVLTTIAAHSWPDYLTLQRIYGSRPYHFRLCIRVPFSNINLYVLIIQVLYRITYYIFQIVLIPIIILLCMQFAVQYRQRNESPRSSHPTYLVCKMTYY